MSISETEKPRPRGRPEMAPALKQEMQTRIASIAEALFHEDGYSNVSMRKIAKEIGCTPMTLYGYYDGKIDILRTLWAGVFEKLFDRLEALPKGDHAQTYLEELGVSYTDYWLKHKDDYRLVFMAEGVTQPDVSLFLDNPDIITRYNLFADAILDLEPSMDEGQLKSKLDFLISALHGIAHNHVTMSGYDWSPPQTQIHYAIAGIL